MTIALSDLGLYVPIVLLIAWLVRLESRTAANEKTINETELARRQDRIDTRSDFNSYENDLKNMELRVITSVDEIRKTIFDLTITLTKWIERVEHFNKTITSIKSKEIKDYFDNN